MNEDRHACRSCGSAELECFLDLGTTPLANALLDRDHADHPEVRYPLRVAFCHGCCLVQILDVVPPSELFEDYPYFSSNSDAMLQHARAIAERMIDCEGLNATSRAGEVASNDGYLLRWYRDAGIPVLGVDPAQNIVAIARQHGIPTECRFFGAELAQELRGDGRQVDVLHANNVLAHVPTLNDVVQGIGLWLRPAGVAVIEAPYVRDMIDNVEFDTIYHEHVFYFSLTALIPLFERHGLTVEHVERLPIHGGSLRLFIRHAAAASSTADVRALIDQERSAGLTDMDYYRDFSSRVATLGDKLQNMLASLAQGGARIAAYGAAAKGATLLNTFGIGPKLIDFVADRSPHKQGKLMPGVHLPIVPPAALLERRPDYVLLLAWNFATEVLEQQAEYRHAGGHFIIPVPEPHVV